MSQPKGFLMVTMEPPPILEEEFNDWYDTEHVPERLRIKGFESGRRFVCVSGWPKYLAFYDLTTIGVLESEEYRKSSWSGFSPWTKRMLTKVRGQYRASGDQIFPGDRNTGDMGRLTLLRFRNVPDAKAQVIQDGMRRCYESRRETTGVRILRSNYNNQIDYIGWIESRVSFSDPSVDPGLFGDAAVHLDIVNEYSPYWSRGHLPGVFGDQK